MKEDKINSPKHYTTGDGVETIVSIRQMLGRDKFIAYCIGNVMKYLSRFEHKNGMEDLRKAQKYIDFIAQEYAITKQEEKEIC